MSEHVAAQTIEMTQQQAEMLTRYPELLARTITMLQQAVDQQIATLDGRPGEFIFVRISAERQFWTEEAQP